MRKAQTKMSELHRIARERAEAQFAHAKLIQNECVRAAAELSAAWNAFAADPTAENADAVQHAHNHYQWASQKQSQFHAATCSAA